MTRQIPVLIDLRTSNRLDKAAKRLAIRQILPEIETGRIKLKTKRSPKNGSTPKIL